MAFPSRLPDTTADLLAEGRESLLGGDRARARTLLKALVQREPDNAEAWLWLAGAQTEPEETERCLRRVLEIDPDHEQAREGLEWVAAQRQGWEAALETDAANPGGPDVVAVAPQPTGRPSQRSTIAGMRSNGRAQAVDGTPSLLDAASGVIAVGALLGLLRLAALLRPATLLLVRPEGPALPLPAALLLAAVAASLHALVLVLAWFALGNAISRARHARRGDRFDSLIQAAQLFKPGYLAGVALVITILALGWSEQRWTPVVVLVWLMLVGAGVLAAQRFRSMLPTLRLPIANRTRYVAGIIGPAVAVALAGFALCGFVVRVLLSQF